MTILDGISHVRGVVSHVQDSKVFEVRSEKGEAMLLYLPGLGIDPIEDVKVGDQVMLTMAKSRVQRVERL